MMRISFGGVETAAREEELLALVRRALALVTPGSKELELLAALLRCAILLLEYRKERRE